MKIVLTGSIAFDYLAFSGYFKGPHPAGTLEKISLSFLVEDMVRQVRREWGANIAYTLALLGEKPLLFSQPARISQNTAWAGAGWSGCERCARQRHQIHSLVLREH